jgi:hypothetical protein
LAFSSTHDIKFGNEKLAVRTLVERRAETARVPVGRVVIVVEV